MISHTKASKTMARLFDADQVADCLSDFDTEAESEDSMYNESESDNSNSSEDDASLDDSDATASDSDSSSSLGGASGDDRDGSRDNVSTNGRGAPMGVAEREGEDGVGEDQE